MPEDAVGIVYRGEDRGPAPDQLTLAATHQTYLSLLTSMAPPPVGAAYAAFENYLKRLHLFLSGGNPALRPGEFKTRPNHAGGTRFVDPAKVGPTLLAGWELSGKIASPFHRAVFLGLAVSEVHPFTDGNGRAARLMTFLTSTMEKLYRSYRELPVRSAKEVLDFCRRENLQD